MIRVKRLEPVDTIAKVFRSWNIMGNTIAWLCMVGIVNVIMAWIPSYLVTVKHFTAIRMGALSSAPFVGAVLGNLLGGWISDRVLKMRRKPLMMVSALSTSIMMYSLIYAPNNAVYLGALLFAMGFLLSLGIFSFHGLPYGLGEQRNVSRGLQPGQYRRLHWSLDISVDRWRDPGSLQLECCLFVPGRLLFFLLARALHHA